MRYLIVILSVILLLAAGALSFIFYSQLQQEKAEIIAVKDRIVFVKERIRETREKITNLELESDELKKSIDEIRLKVENYNTEVVKLKSKNADIFAQLHEKRIVLNSYKSQLRNLIDEGKFRKDLFRAA